MSEGKDPTFYRSPAAAIEAPGEKLAYVAAFDPAGELRDAMTVVDYDAESESFGEVVGWTGSNRRQRAASLRLERVLQRPVSRGPRWRARAPLSDRAGSALVAHVRARHPARPAPAADGADDRARGTRRKPGYSRRHTVHCGPGGIFMSNLGAADGEGPGGVALIDHDTFEVTGAWETDRGEQYFSYDIWWHLNEDVAITSEWATRR